MRALQKKVYLTPPPMPFTDQHVTTPHRLINGANGSPIVA